ncbi:stage III sporulation protein AA [Herbivorax sp. ANBcel31]|uniref:stage III sporulation protein AA n=1 Tax=Herbivorax sp. ANBcel31 TaxID=3069754 RepID=UPI0027B8374C|nr:stage III sporulation protein AA [Herbivorax sp. ANBcel31]MDQ2085299.1 stage III sporulation protein AA [Herbivorax sp. ANBcel31]
MITKDKQIVKMEQVRSFERDILMFLCNDLKDAFKKANPLELVSLEEIRLRAGKPVMIQNRRGSFFFSREGKITNNRFNLFYASQEHILKTLALISENSIYAFQEEIKNGFLTLKGGHRVGITGRVVLEGGNIKNIKDISGLNIRISKEVTGCSSSVTKYIINDNNQIFNTLLVSPPQCGKTTMLRDITRSISDGIDRMGFRGVKAGIIDERSEIAACHKGVPQKRVGVRTDVLDACPKQLGMAIMLRSMSPDVIVTDEIGGSGDKHSIMQVLNAGIKIISTAHGYNISGLKTRKEVLSLIEEKIFERFIVLSAAKGPGTVEEVIDGKNMKVLFRREENGC